MNGEKLLHIYLADHLTVAVGVHALAKRCRSANRNTALGAYLDERLVPEFEEDRAALENVMDSIGATKAIYKQIAARVAVQAGRLKLNGRALSYSPLSRLEELDALCLGVEGKMLMWRSLRALPPDGLRRIRGVHLDRLIERAERQRAELEGHRLEAAAVALTSD